MPYRYGKSIMNLFKIGNFTLRSGFKSHWKIDCDALTEEDWETLAYMIHEQVEFGSVIGIPMGGLKLADALEGYCSEGYPILIVDDVLTTGESMENMRKEVGDNSIGVVIFARGKCSDWIFPVFRIN